MEITQHLILKESYRFSESNGQFLFCPSKVGMFLSVVKLTAV